MYTEEMLICQKKLLVLLTLQNGLFYFHIFWRVFCFGLFIVILKRFTYVNLKKNPEIPYSQINYQTKLLHFCTIFFSLYM